MRLEPDAVHCWYVDLDVPPGEQARLRATLSADERSRSARFVFERDRRRFVVAHGALREILGRYLGTRPSRLRFVRSASGKPRLGRAAGRRVAFNLSHSADFAAVAVAPAEVGVDVERVRPEPDCDEIARCCFPAAEVERLDAVPGPRRAGAFFRCWTRMEACAKARGEGLTMRCADAPAGLAAGGRWSLRSLRPAPGYVGALAVEGHGWRLEERRWRSGGFSALPPRGRSPW